MLPLQAEWWLYDAIQSVQRWPPLCANRMDDCSQKCESDLIDNNLKSILLFFSCHRVLHKNTCIMIVTMCTQNVAEQIVFCSTIAPNRHHKRRNYYYILKQNTTHTYDVVDVRHHQLVVIANELVAHVHKCVKFVYTHLHKDFVKIVSYHSPSKPWQLKYR